MELNVVERTATPRRKIIALKSTQCFLIAAIILMTLVITVLCIGFLVRYEVVTDVWNVDSVKYWKDPIAEEQKFWYNDGVEELKSALEIDWEATNAQNIIIFVTHGIEDDSLASVRFDTIDGKVRSMVWENFEHIGFLSTDCVSTTNCIAKSFGTALFSGVETIQGVEGLDSSVLAQNCAQAMDKKHYVKSILRMAQESNFRNGFVTTKSVSGQLMSSLYAHTPEYSWECDSSIPPNKQLQGCKDIATQLIEEETGMGINVIMGGGRQTLMSSIPISDEDPLDEKICNSHDGRNYIRDWHALKRLKGESNAVIQNFSELKKFNGSNVDYVMGIFANGNLIPSWQSATSEENMPELADMVEKALEVLMRKDERFLLVVESGNEFENDLNEQIKVLERLNSTIDRMLQKISSDTLLVTLFMDDDNKMDLKRSNLTENSTHRKKFEGLSGSIKLMAKGPSSHLLHGIHDVTYVSQALSFALKIGPYKKPDKK